MEIKKGGFCRRDFLKYAAVFGTTATLGGFLAACSTGEDVDEKIREQAAKENDKARKADFNWDFAVDGVTDRWSGREIYQPTMYCLGAWNLKNAIEKHSNGRISVQMHEAGVLGNQVETSRAVQMGSVQLNNASTQNMAGYAAVWNVIDFPYVVGDLENWWRLIYSKEINDTLRKASKNMGVIPLTIFPQLRWIELARGLPEVRKPSDIRGFKMRVTGSRLEQEAFNILPANPTPIGWGEVYTAMQSGAIDGIHVGPASVADASIHEVCGQIINTEFMANSDSCWLNAREFDSLPKDLQEKVMEAAFDAQVFIEETYEKLHKYQIGIRPDSPSDAIYREAGVKVTFLSDNEKKEWIDYLSYENNKEKYDPLIDRFGRKEFEVVKEVANSTEKPQAKRWWK